MRTFYLSLGKGWQISGSLDLHQFGLGLVFEYRSRDDFYLSAGIGPFSFVIGRDFYIHFA